MRVCVSPCLRNHLYLHKLGCEPSHASGEKGVYNIVNDSAACHMPKVLSRYAVCASTLQHRYEQGLHSQ